MIAINSSLENMFIGWGSLMVSGCSIAIIDVVINYVSIRCYT